MVVLPEVLNGSDDSSLQDGISLGLPDHRENIFTKQLPGTRQASKDLALFSGGFLQGQAVGAVLKENAVLLANVGAVVDAAPGGYRAVRYFLWNSLGSRCSLPIR